MILKCFKTFEPLVVLPDDIGFNNTYIVIYKNKEISFYFKFNKHD